MGRNTGNSLYRCCAFRYVCMESNCALLYHCSCQRKETYKSVLIQNICLLKKWLTSRQVRQWQCVHNSNNSVDRPSEHSFSNGRTVVVLTGVKTSFNDANNLHYLLSMRHLIVSRFFAFYEIFTSSFLYDVFGFQKMAQPIFEKSTVM